MNAASDDTAKATDSFRLGAIIFLGSFAALVLTSLVTLACACRQRAIRRRAQVKRWAKLLQHYATIEEGGCGDQSMTEPHPLHAAAERLLPAPHLDHERNDSPQSMRGGAARGKGDPARAVQLRHEVAAVAARHRAESASAWWAVIATWIITAAAAISQLLLAARLGLLSLDPSEVESPATDDVGLMLFWQSDDAGGGRAESALLAPPKPSDGSPVLALSLPAPSWEHALQLDATTQAVVALLFACVLAPLGSLLILLLVMPWTPPDPTPPHPAQRNWQWVREHVLAVLESVGIWSLLPVCVLMLLAATVQTTVPLLLEPQAAAASAAVAAVAAAHGPSSLIAAFAAAAGQPVPDPPPGHRAAARATSSLALEPAVALHLELSIGCGLTLFVTAASLTLLAVNQAAVATATYAEGSSGSMSTDASANASANVSACNSACPSGAVTPSGIHSGTMGVYAAVPTANGAGGPGRGDGRGARAGRAAASAEAAAAVMLHVRGVGRRRVLAALLHGLSALLVLASLPLPALEIAPIRLTAGGGKLAGFPSPPAAGAAKAAAVAAGVAAEAEALVGKDEERTLLGPRYLSLLDAASGAIGTPMPPDTMVLLHGNWVGASELCSLAVPTPAYLVALLLLGLLAGPPVWRALKAARGLGSYMRAIEGQAPAGSAVRDGSQRRVRSSAAVAAVSSGAWRLADVLSAALLCIVLLMRSVGHTFASSAAGEALRQFAGVGLEWRATWGDGAWLLLAAAVSDLLGRLLMWLVSTKL